MRSAWKWVSPAAIVLSAQLCGEVWGEEALPPASVSKPPATADLRQAAEAKPVLRHGVFKYTSYPAAWTSAQETNRPILVFATAPGCPHCVRMVGETYRSPQVSRFVNESFETVYVDRTEQPELAAKLKIRWFPTTIVVGPDNQVLDVIEGYVDSKTFAQRLQTTVAAHTAATQTR